MKDSRAGAIAIVSALLMANAGGFPVLGVLAGVFAPDVFLIGLALLAHSFIKPHVHHPAVRWGLLGLFVLLVALNTRLPAIVSDFQQSSHLTVNQQLSIAPGAVLKLETNVAKLRVRRDVGASVAPACGEGCFTTHGFDNPFETQRQIHWDEPVARVANNHGFAVNAGGYPVAMLRVAQTPVDELRSDVDISMQDASGRMLAHFNGRVRFGYPLECATCGDSPNLVIGTLLFVIHGNSISTWISRWSQPAMPQQPLSQLLREVVTVSGPSTEVRHVRAEIVEERVFEPPQVFRDGDATASMWASLLNDRVRMQKCDAFLNRGAEWHTFRVDERKRINRSAKVLCEEQAIWAITDNYATSPPVIEKHSPAGDLQYRLQIEMPPRLPGFRPFIMTPTFMRSDGYLSFQCWDSERLKSQHLVKRVMHLRVPEPT